VAIALVVAAVDTIAAEAAIAVVVGPVVRVTNVNV
jgi:hypothetical protein